MQCDALHAIHNEFIVSESINQSINQSINYFFFFFLFRHILVHRHVNVGSCIGKH